MKKLLLLILLGICFTSCVTININTKPNIIKQYQNYSQQDSLLLESSWY